MSAEFFSAWVLGFLACSAPLLGAQKELLRDGDFEKAGKSSSPGWTHVWPQSLQPQPKFTYPNEDAHGGKRCAEIAVAYTGGFTSLTQEVDLPRKTDWVRLTGHARLEPDSPGGSAWLVLAFIGKDLAEAELRQTRRVTTSGTWEELALEAAVPEGTTRLMLRCGVFGPARARFDDLTLLGGEGERPRDEAALIETHGYWRVESEAGVAEPTIDVSVPFPFAAQTPLALRVESDPPGRVADLALLAERENRPLRIRLTALEPGESVRLHVRTLVLVRRRDLPEGAGVDLVSAGKVPAELREFLRPAPGIECEDARIRTLARGFARRDLARLVQDLFGYLGREIAAGGGDQGALATLESRDAACTGHANLGAALMIAAGVPTRVLACLLVGNVQQEHYVIESWTKALGWQRIETTLKAFPVADALHVILRVVYPEAERSPMNVPLFWRLGAGLRGGLDGERLERTGCWQSAEERAQLTLEAGRAEAIERAARAAFEGLVSTPAAAAEVRFAPEELPDAIDRRLASFLGQ